jgi:thiol-disulfide isomerase/thioredoxin
MNRFIPRALLGLLLGATLAHAQIETPAAAAAPTLKIGDPAPALTVGTWIKGEPVTAFADGTIYVVEFWATWCGPCRKTIPHMSELQAKYQDKGVVIIGQNISDADADVVTNFVAAMGDKMNYRVVLDDTSTTAGGAMSAAWMDASGQSGIPTAFVVDQKGRLAWIGHPMAELDAVIEQLVAGTYDVEGQASAMNKRQELESALQNALREEDSEKALAAIDKLAAEFPEEASQLVLMKFGVLLQAKDYSRAYALGTQLSDAIKDDAQTLNEVAWTLTTDETIEQRDLDLALQMALRASELTSNSDAAILDTVARVYFEKGDLARAIELQTKALEKAGDEDKAVIQESLDKYLGAQKAADAP